MAKKQSKKKQSESKLTREQKIHIAHAAAAAGKTVTIKEDADINIVINSWFRNYLIDTFHYIVNQESEANVTKAFVNIRDQFKNIPKDAPPDPFLNAVWTITTLLNEINYCAAEQGHTVITDEPFDEKISTFINSLNTDYDYSDHSEEEIREMQGEFIKDIVKDYKEQTSTTPEFKESEFDGEKAGQTSSED